MTRPAVPPGLAKARAERKADVRARKNGGKLGQRLLETMNPTRPTPAQDLREEKAQAFAPPPDVREWSGKNDGTPGCLRTREPLRRVVYVVPRPGGAWACSWCGRTRWFRIGARKACTTCHRPAEGVETFEDQEARLALPAPGRPA